MPDDGELNKTRQENARFELPPEEIKPRPDYFDPVLDVADPFEGLPYVEVVNPWTRPPNAHDREAFKGFLRTKKRG